MKNVFFLLIIISIALNIGCAKENESLIMPSSAKINKLTSLCRHWELNTYTIKTDEMNYYFTGTGISTHALRTLTFHKDRTYTAGNNVWSGTFGFSDDSTQVILTPTDTTMIPMTFTIDHFSPQQIQFSSPQVNVNPENPHATDYEKLVAFQGLSWLYNRSVDISKLGTIKIQFTYYLNPMG
jgi:hypothetical protein